MIPFIRAPALPSELPSNESTKGEPLADHSSLTHRVTSDSCEETTRPRSVFRQRLAFARPIEWLAPTDIPSLWFARDAD